MTPTLLDTALALHRAGCSVVPVRADGSKAPAVHWKELQASRPTVDQLETWFAAPSTYDGLGVVTGAVSSNLEMLELEGRAVDLAESLVKLMADNGAAELWQRLCNGYLEVSPSGGFHWVYRVLGDAKPNTKLARRPATADELDAFKSTERAKAEQTLAGDKLERRLEKIAETTPEQVPQVLIETRGEGGFTVVAPSSGRTHPTGKAWQLIHGGPSTIPDVTVEERDLLHAITGMLDAMPAAVPATTAPRRGAPTFDGRGGATTSARPGDDFNARTTWDQILTPHGWTKAGSLRPGELAWVRPGKNPTDGISATTGLNDGDNLYVFSTSTEFETDVPYTKFAAYALLEHRGDYSAAARYLRARGYGGQDEWAAFGLASPTVLTTPGRDDGGTPPDGPAGEQTQDPPPRPPIEVTNPAIAAAQLRDLLGTGRLAGMFRRGDDLVYTARVGEAGYVAPPAGDDGIAQVRTVRDPRVLASHVDLAYNVFRMTGRADAKVPTAALFPTEAARAATNVPHQMPNLQQLDGVTHSPILRVDGTLLEHPGYDPATKLLHLPEPGLVVPPVAEQPAAADLAAAAALLAEMTAGFDFVTPHDRANYYGLLLTPLLRLMTPPPYKLGAISSPSPGSGKSLLATLARIIHGGVFRAELPIEDELRKQVTSMLTMTTGPIIHFDNLSGVLRSSTLAGLLTSNTWGDRPLGSTEWVGTPNDRLWLVTGNNIALGGDLVRRTVWVTIDPGVPNPERRTHFAITDLKRWATDRRGDLLHALLTVVRSWVVAGRPLPVATASDDYASWSRTINGILAHAGIDGVFGHEDSAPEALGVDDDEWVDFLDAVHDTFGLQPWTVAELLDKVDTGVRYDGWPTSNLPTGARPIAVDTLPVDLATRARRDGLPTINRSLGNYLKNRRGRWAGDYAVQQVDRTSRSKKSARWQLISRLTPADPQTPASRGDRGSEGSGYIPTRSENTGEVQMNGLNLTPADPLAPPSTCGACGAAPATSSSLYCDHCLNVLRRASGVAERPTGSDG
ncbi:hypothetical protein GCM10023340_08320 [Nocardioides marinquilinus]|uniref:DNA primase/polymerase bifunctional N-terminal domain-containing protein n=1 Tax=Nocardioides marinquilinus TaxID=1210400 RepID=A0ABP9PBW5_9ACTN